MLKKIKLQHVHYMPKKLESGILYVSEEFGAVAHLCACGCGEKIRTPLGPTEWSFTETGDGPSLYPSIGNWQKPCQSHYWISEGEIKWADQWTPGQIAAGYKREEETRVAYYNATTQNRGIWNCLKSWFHKLFG